MVCFALVQASHSNTMCSLPFYIHITCLVNLKVNSAFLQPVLFREAIELSASFVNNHPQITDLPGQEDKKMRKEKKKLYEEK